MSRIDKAPEGGNYRAKAAAALDGTAGAWGDDDLLCVAVDGNGELVAAAAGTAEGLIWTYEGRKEGVASNNEVIGGRVYTVFRECEIVDIENGTPALAAGDKVFAAAAGDVDTTGAVSAVKVGVVVDDDRGPRLVVRFAEIVQIA